MSNSFSEFRKEILKVSKPRNYEITHSYEIRDIYRALRKEKKLSLNERQFSDIIRGVNKKIAYYLLQEEDIILPHKMGRLELRKRIPELKIKDGKLIAPMPIDWDKTLKLWWEDEEAKTNKQIIRLESKEIFRLNYNKVYASYKNKDYFKLTTNRKFKNALKCRVNEGGLDAYLIDK